MAIAPSSFLSDSPNVSLVDLDAGVISKRGTLSQRIAVVVSLAFLALALVMAVYPQLLAPSNPLALHPTLVLEGPAAAHFLGTDQYGRSIATTLAYGARPALVIGFVGSFGGGIVGSAMGILAGYFGRATDQAIMRVNDVLMSFPGLLLALMISAALGPSFRNEVLAVAVAAVPIFARIARSETLTARSALYTDAAVVAGLPLRRILFRHVLPNVVTPLVVVATIGVGLSIVLGATLSFLGLGPIGGVPDWGTLLASGENYIGTAWWISTFPGVAITLVVVATNVIGDWLRDRLDSSAT